MQSTPVLYTYQVATALLVAGPALWLLGRLSLVPGP